MLAIASYVNEDNELKENVEGYMGGLMEGKRSDKCNYIIISKVK